MPGEVGWEKLSDALTGSFQKDLVGGLLDAYKATEGKIEAAYKRAISDLGAGQIPLQRMLILRTELEEGLKTLELPKNLQVKINRVLAEGKLSADYWALAELNDVKKTASNVKGLEDLAERFKDADSVLSPAMAAQNPSALIAAAQRSDALQNYAGLSPQSALLDPKVFNQLNSVATVDLRGRIMGSVEFHLAQGDSWRQLNKTLKQNVGLAANRAEMIAKTEMSAAMVEGTKMRYEKEGIKEVKWVATESERTCPICVSRHGYVYRLGEMVVPAHPRCRCALVPWEQEWIEKGLIDQEAEKADRQRVVDQLKKSTGKDPNYGPSVFERSLNKDKAPKPLWKPGDKVNLAPNVKTGPQIATYKSLPDATRNGLEEFKKVNLENEKHQKWFLNQRIFNSTLIPEGKFNIITPKELGKLIEKNEIAKLQQKYDKAFKKSLLPPKQKVPRAPLKKWDDPSFIDRRLAKSSKASSVRKRGGTGRKWEDSHNWKPIAEDYNLTNAQLKDVTEIVGEWCGSDYRSLRGVQLKQAKAAGAQLNANQVNTLKDFELSSLSQQSTWARKADKMEDFISKSPRWKGAPQTIEDLAKFEKLEKMKGVTGKELKKKLDFEKADIGTVYRGMTIKDRATVEAIIDSFQEGNASLTMESWTSSRVKAGNFALQETARGGHQVILKHKNKYGVSINPWNGHGELEVLQPRGVRYRVKEVVQQTWGEESLGYGQSLTEITLEAL